MAEQPWLPHAARRHLWGWTGGIGAVPAAAIAALVSRNTQSPMEQLDGPGGGADIDLLPDHDHIPSAHRRYAEWTPERFRRWGRTIGLNTVGLVLAILANRPHPEQGFRTCLGVLRLFKDLDPERRADHHPWNALTRQISNSDLPA